MKGLKPTFISILAIGLLAGSAVGVAAQDADTEELTTPLYYTGTAGEAADVVEGTFSEDDRVLRGQHVVGVPIETDDPRLGGLLDIVINGHSEVTDEGGAILESRSYRTVNDGGAWVGSGTYVEAWDADADAPHIVRETAVLHGEGDYEGLIAYMTVDHLADEGFEGVVFGVEVPPVPEPPAE